MQALLDTGHTLNMHFIEQLLPYNLELFPLRVVRCLLKHGLRFSDELLQAAARYERVDVLQLACDNGHAARITAQLISMCAEKYRCWQVVVWAARNNIALDIAHLTTLLIINAVGEYSCFAFESQREELCGFLTQLAATKLLAALS